MSITNPSQYECDNAQPGDLFFIKHRGIIYRWYRDKFLKDKIKVYINENWNTDKKIPVYQEDCTLIFKWELQGRSEFENEVPYYIGFNNKYISYGKRLKRLQFGSENVSIILKGGFSILIPIEFIRNGLLKLDNTRQYIDRERQVHTALRFARYKGDFFKKRCAELNLSEWDISYCTLCGKPLKFKFDKEEPYMENQCTCGNMILKDEPINWDTVAYWFNSQTHQPFIDKYKEFWKI